MKITKELEKKIKKAGIIAVTGTPATGKTTFSKVIAKKYKFSLIDVNRMIKEKKLYDSYDKKKKCFVVDEKKLAKYLEKIINQAKKENKKLVIDSHLSHYLSPKLVDLCIVTVCGYETLYKRLKKRKYHTRKIEENLECEIMEIVAEEARKLGHRVEIVNMD